MHLGRGYRGQLSLSLSLAHISSLLEQVKQVRKSRLLEQREGSPRLKA